MHYDSDRWTNYCPYFPQVTGHNLLFKHSDFDLQQKDQKQLT